MKTTKAWGRVGVLLAFPIAACSTLVGADFDDLVPAGAAGGSAGSSVNGGTTTNAGSGGVSGQAPLGGAGAE